MRTIKTLIALAALILASGCVTQKFDSFTTQPAQMLGVGIDNGWMWVDASSFGDELVKNGVNCTSIEVFGCGPTKDTWPTLAIDPKRGHWMEPSRWGEVKDKLDDFMDAMKERRITVNVTLTGWNYRGGATDPANGKPSTICSTRFDDAWFANAVSYFASRGTEGVILTASAEPGIGRNMECISKFDRWTAILNSKWQGMKGWNKGARPKSAPAGYFIVYHPANQNDTPPKGSIVLTDSPVGGTIFQGSPAETATLNPAAATAYARKVRLGGSGFITYGYPFTSWKIDKDGIKAVGSAK